MTRPVGVRAFVATGALFVGLAGALGGGCGSGAAGGTGAGGASNCTGGPFPVTCEACIEKSCCAEAAACYGDPLCASCTGLFVPDPDSCVADETPRWEALLTCVRSSCASTCLPTSTCNPVTNAGCDAPAACDLDQDGVYLCFAPDTSVGLCSSCSGENGPPCDPTLHCLEADFRGTCARYCCDDSDCAGGTCDMTIVPGGAGLCVNVTPVDAGVVALTPVCDAPVVAPSGGTCAPAP